MGIAKEMTSVLGRLRMKKRSTRRANPPPYKTDWATLEMDRSIKLPWLMTGTILIWGKALLTSSILAKTRRETSTVLASACFRMATRRPRSPFTRMILVNFS